MEIDINKCGIVILNYNSHDLTVKLAEKVASFSTVHHICVVDNNSQDNFDNDFNNEKIKYIKNKSNTGYSAGNNVGLKYLIDDCGCGIVFIANPDTIFDNKTIEVLQKHMLSNPKTAIASTMRFGHNNEKIHQYFDFPSLSTSMKNCFFVFRRKFEKNRHNKQNIAIKNTKGFIKVDAVPGAFFGIRSEFLIKNNYLYEGIFLYGEEIILGRQARNLGYNAVVCNESSYVHDHIGARFDNRKMFWLDRKSLLEYYRMFENFGIIKNILLRICIVLGTIEYNCAYFLYHLLKGSIIKK